MKLPLTIKALILVVILGVLFSYGRSVYSTSVGLFNQTKEISLEYDKTKQLQITSYDADYLNFIDQQENANINKETFIEVTNIIMANRRDGANLSWKWVQENQQIPYSEFTQFYKNLSAFISTRYANNANIESTKQELVRKHNTLLKLYPNNLINEWILEVPDLVYEQGYVSDATKARFKQDTDATKLLIDSVPATKADTTLTK